MDIFWLFFRRYLLSPRAGAIVRSMAKICWLATMIGVFALILVSSIMNGFNKSIRQKLLSVEPHLIVTGDKTTLKSIKDLFKGNSSVETFDFQQQDVIVRTLDGHFSGSIAKGLPKEAINGFLNRTNKLHYKKGMAPELDPSQADLNWNEIIIGTNLAAELGVYAGDEILLIPPSSLLGSLNEAPRLERMRVKSTYSTDFSDIDSKLILYRLSDKPLRFQSPSSSEKGIEFRLTDPDKFSDIESTIKKNLPASASYKMESWRDRNKSLFLALKLEKTAMMTFLSLSVLITCFSLITVLILLISQKRKEIGLLMAIGFSRKRTEKLFLILGLFLSGFGLFIGLAMGIFASYLIAKYPVDILPDIYYDSSLPSELNFTFVVGVAIFCLIITVIAAYWPIRLYMKHSPSENLRPFVAD